MVKDSSYAKPLVPLSFKGDLMTVGEQRRFDSLIKDRLSHFQSLIEEIDSNAMSLAFCKTEFGAVSLNSDEALAKSLILA